jgi:hypothetical protein
MKTFNSKLLSLLMLASCGIATASRYEDGYRDADCCTRQYECGCNPLYCGAWDLQVQGGVSPILWRHRGPITGVRTVDNSCELVTLFGNTPRFNKLHKVPWIVGGQVGYAMSDNSRVYVEFNYSQAKGKNTVALNSDFTTPAAVFTFSGDKYKLFDGYVGARYYFDRWCDSVSFFVGGKVGFTHHKKQNLNLVIQFTDLTEVTLPEISPFYSSNTVIAGGGHIGLDYCICGNWSLVLTGEVVASCGPRAIGALTLPDLAGLADFTNLLFSSVGSELRFPVTLALRYSF